MFYQVRKDLEDTLLSGLPNFSLPLIPVDLYIHNFSNAQDDRTAFRNWQVTSTLLIPLSGYAYSFGDTPIRAVSNG
jgi:hypothetical protein